MIELLRTFLGYCINCKRPAAVGEFKLQGWQHTFNLCDSCLSTMQKKLLDEETRIITKMQQEQAGSRI
jgi:hypothetical protein